MPDRSIFSLPAAGPVAALTWGSGRNLLESLNAQQRVDRNHLVQKAIRFGQIGL